MQKLFTLRNILINKEEPEIRVILETDVHQKAVEKEIELIKKYGRKDLNQGRLYKWY